MAIREPDYRNVTYQIWNDALCEHFFSDATEKIIYLYVNEDVVLNVGTTLGIPLEECLESFCQSVASYVTNVDELFERSHKRGVSWYNQGAVGYPPFIGALSLTVLAATKMEADETENIGGGNYYYQLRKLLNMTNGQGIPRHFEEFVHLWPLLLRWQKDNQGHFGYTYSFAFSSIPYCGYPRSQCLVRDMEHDLLSEFFSSARYTPALELSTDRIAKDLELFLSTRPASRFSRQFFNKTPGLKDAIINMVSEEFNKWEPEFDPDNATKAAQRVQLSVLLDEGSVFDRKLNLSLISPPIYVDDKNTTSAGFFYRNGYYVRPVADPSDLGTNITDFVNDIQLMFKGRPVFVFRRAGDQGLSGWLSRSDIKPQQEHLLLYPVTVSDAVRAWVESNQFDGQHSTSTEGVPEGWMVRRVSVPQHPVSVKPLNDIGAMIRLGEAITTAFIGGLRVGYNQWLHGFCPVLLVSAPPGTVCTIDAEEIPCVEHGNELIHLDEYIKTPGSHSIRIGDKTLSFNLIDTDQTLLSAPETQPHHLLPVDNITVEISGMYVSDNIQELPSPVRLQGYGTVWISAESRIVEQKTKESIIRCGPFIKGIDFLSVRTDHEKTLSLRPVDFLIQYLAFKRQGNWEAFLQAIEVCFGRRDYLVAYNTRRSLSEHGIVEFRAEAEGSNRFRWTAIPKTAYILPLRDYAVSLSGTWPIRHMLSEFRDTPLDIFIHVPDSDFEPTTVYIAGESMEQIYDVCTEHRVRINRSKQYFGYDLIRTLPTVSQYIDGAVNVYEPSERFVCEGWDVAQHRWREGSNSALRRYQLGYGRRLFLLDLGRVAKQVDPDYAKLFIASKQHFHLMSYKDYKLSVEKEYILPQLYSRALISTSGTSPVEASGFRIYRNVPGELAIVIAYKLGFTL